MNNNKWLTLLGGMLMALFLVLGLSPPGRASAYVESLPDSDRDYLNVAIQQAFAGTLNTDFNGYVTGQNTYIVYTVPQYDDRVYLFLSCDIDYFEFNGEAISAHSDCKVTASSTHKHSFRVMRYFLGSYDRLGLYYNTVDSMSYADGIDGKTFYLPDLPFSDLGKVVLASNVSFKDDGGTVFFARTPLAASWLKTADQAIQEKLVEVRKNRPHLPELGQIQMGLMIVACCLVSLVLLTKLLRVWKNSLIR